MKQNIILSFLKKLFLFILILIVLDQAIGWTLRKLYFGQRKGILAQTTYAIDSANQDILIFGSSKAYRQYSPNIISEGTGLSCYNLGQDAQKIAYYTAVQEIVLKRKKPRLIILDVLAKELYEDELNNSKLWMLYPYCKEHPELKKYLQELGPFEKIKFEISVYPFNSLLFIMANNKILEKHITKDAFGYKPYAKSISKKDFDAYLKERAKYTGKIKKGNTDRVSQKSKNYLQQFLESTKQNNIQTLLLISPSLIAEPLVFRDKIRGLSLAYPNVRFIDFSDSSKYSHQYQKFADLNHLNKEGAEEFSREVNGLIKNYLK